MDKRARPWVGGALVAVGAIWILQGLGIVTGGFMEDSLFWVGMGILLLTGGGLLLAGARDRKPPPR